MLEDLEVINGVLELKFDKYNYEYTVEVKDNIKSLEFTYKLLENSYINIRNNELNGKENIVYIDVFNSSEFETYTFYVYKENTSTTSGIDEYKASLQINEKQEIDYYKVEILSVGIFLTIVILFSVIFRRKKV